MNHYIYIPIYKAHKSGEGGKIIYDVVNSIKVLKQGNSFVMLKEVNELLSFKETQKHFKRLYPPPSP